MPQYGEAIDTGFGGTVITPTVTPHNGGLRILDPLNNPTNDSIMRDVAADGTVTRSIYRNPTDGTQKDLLAPPPTTEQPAAEPEDTVAGGEGDLIGQVGRGALAPIVGGPSVPRPANVPFSGPRTVSYTPRRVAPGETFEGVDPATLRQQLPFIDTENLNVDDVERATIQRALNRLTPHWERERAALAQHLADRGLDLGSEAYTGELDRFERGVNDARENIALSGVGAGRAEHSRLVGLASALRGIERDELERQLRFNASEAARNFNERLSSEGQYAGQRQFGDQFAANQAARADSQAIAQNQFAASNDLNRRQAWWNEQAYNQNSPLTNLARIMALTGQVQPPPMVPVTQFGPAPVNYAGIHQFESQRPSGWGNFLRGAANIASRFVF